MFQSLLSVLFLGIVPAVGPAILPSDAPQFAIAPPAAPIAVLGRLSASGVIVLDQRSGQQVFARQPDEPRPIASLTKLMTALIIAENHEMDEVITIPANVARIEGSKAYLPPGEQFFVKDVLSALLIPSANDAAETLAIYHSGSVAAFVEAMNERVKTLGLKHTSFANPTGLDNAHQWSTPQEIAWMTEAALRIPIIEQLLGQRSAHIRSLQGTVIDLLHTHALIRAHSPVVAGKTGTTTAAGQCLVSVVEQEGTLYTVVLLNSLQRYKDMQTILAALKPSSPPDETEVTTVATEHGG